MRATALVLFLASSALADNTADEASVSFQTGNEAYAKGEYRKALAAYFHSDRLAPNKNVLFNVARCYEALKSYDEAYRYYNDVLSRNPSPNDVADVKGALARLQPHVALVVVNTEPPGADVFVDREDLGSRGRSPVTLAMKPGAHKVRAAKAGMRTAEVAVTARLGGSTKASLTLSPIVGVVEIQGEPAGASIRETADGPALGTLPAKLTLPPGQRLFVVSHPGFTSSQLLITVKADETVQAKAVLSALPPPTGKLVITANRENALVRIDGKDSGFTPTVLVLPVGRHELEVSQKDQRTFSRTVEISADAELRVAAELRFAAPRVRAASKSLTNADEASASITVIGREEILALGYQTLSEAVQGVRGISLSDDRIYTYLGVRGFSPPGDLNTRVLILYDGHAMNDVWAGQGYSAKDLDVDLSEIERIEIVRGPGSALYGTGAFFAVINLVPREAVAGDRNVEGIAGAGGLGAVKARAAAGYAGKSASVLASGGGFFSSGDQTTDLGARGLVVGNDAERSLGGTVRARLGDFTLSTKLTHRLKHIPVAPYGTVVGAPGTQYIDARGFGEVRWEHEWDRFTLAARAYYDGSRFFGTYAYEGADPDGPLSSQKDFGGADWGGVEVRARVRLFDGNYLTIGLEGQHQFVQQFSLIEVSESPALENRQRTLLSAYLLDEWKITSWLSLTLGVRLDKYLDLTALPITPRVGLVLRPYQGGLTKLVAGQAFRAPNIYELYYGDNFVSQRPPGALKPETITTIEAEHSHDFTDELRASVSGYVNFIDALVVVEQEELDPPECGATPNTEQCLVNRNSSRRIYATGAEAEVRWQPSRSLFLNASYSFVKLWDASADITAGTVMHLVSAKAVVPLHADDLRLAVQATYNSPRSTGSGPGIGEALFLHLGLSGQFSHLRYFAGVRNLLDVKSPLPTPTGAGFDTVPQYGRTLWFEVAANF